MQKDLVNQLKANSEDAFKLLVETYKEKVLNTCYHFLHNELDAEDLAQEVFIEVFRSIGHSDKMLNSRPGFIGLR